MGCGVFFSKKKILPSNTEKLKALKTYKTEKANEQKPEPWRPTKTSYSRMKIGTGFGSRGTSGPRVGWKLPASSFLWASSLRRSRSGRIFRPFSTNPSSAPDPLAKPSSTRFARSIIAPNCGPATFALKRTSFPSPTSQFRSNTSRRNSFLSSPRSSTRSPNATPHPPSIFSSSTPVWTRKNWRRWRNPFRCRSR